MLTSSILFSCIDSSWGRESFPSFVMTMSQFTVSLSRQLLFTVLFVGEPVSWEPTTYPDPLSKQIRRFWWYLLSWGWIRIHTKKVSLFFKQIKKEGKKFGKKLWCSFVKIASALSLQLVCFTANHRRLHASLQKLVKEMVLLISSVQCAVGKKMVRRGAEETKQGPATKPHTA